MKLNFKSLVVLLETKIKDIKQYQSEYKKLDTEINNLKKQGMVNAKPSWRKGRYPYLYLVHPMVNGERVREYIGKDKKAINVALKKVENYKIFIKKKSRQEQILCEINEFKNRLEPRFW